jgi:hypothetical protein
MRRTLLGAVLFVLLFASAPAAACTPPAVWFALGSFHLDRASLAEVDRVTASWRGRPSQQIVLTAGADRVGPADSNMRLSRRRGEAVRAALVRRGVPVSLIRLAATGETDQGRDGFPESFYRVVWMELVDASSVCG